MPGRLPRRQLSAGQETTCAAINGGPIRCWGSNLARQLDMDSQTQPTTSVEVTELGTGARSVAVGNGDVCAVTAGGAVKCWGSHYSSGAQDVPPLSSGIVAVAAGAPYFDHTCALTEAGGVKCWGANNFGQLGNGSATGRRRKAQYRLTWWGFKTPTSLLKSGSRLKSEFARKVTLVRE